MTQKLLHITQIHSGIYAKPSLSGDAIYLRANDFDEYGDVLPTIKPDLKLPEKWEKHLLQEGDILFVAKGYQPKAFLYDKTIGPAIASSTFLVIRIKNFNQIQPGFLTWWINHPTSQQYLKAFSKGSSLPSISKKVLGELSVPVPDLKRQNHILHLHKLRNQEKQLTTQIESLKDQLIQAKLESAINSMLA